MFICSYLKGGELVEDKLIIKYINKQKEEGLSLLIEVYGDYINTIVKNNLRMLPNHQEECLNDILLSIWMNIKDFDNKKNTLKNWIGVVSKYKTIDYKRKYLNELKLYDIDDDLNIIDKNLLECEIKEEVNYLLQNLNEKDRQLFIKRYIEDLDIDTIAKEMNTSSSNIYMRISRCKQKLRKLVTKN